MNRIWETLGLVGITAAVVVIGCVLAWFALVAIMSI